MSQASRKRSRQEPGHPVIYHPFNHKRILGDKIREDVVVARKPKKGRNVNAEGFTFQKPIKINTEINKLARLPCVLAEEEAGYLNASEIRLHNLEFDTTGSIMLNCDALYLQGYSTVISASVIVEIPPLPEDCRYEVGWVHAISDFKQIYVYGNDGITSLEVPELVTGKYSMVNAAKSVLIPWFGHTTEMKSIEGPTMTPTFLSLSMEDRLSMLATWKHPATREAPNLTYVYFKKQYYTYLVLKDLQSNICQIIETLSWCPEVAIDVDPTKPLGERAKVRHPHAQEGFKIAPLYLTPPMDVKALNLPTCDSTVINIWRPKNGNLEVLESPMNSTYADFQTSRIRTENDYNEIVRLSKIKFKKEYEISF